MLAPRRVIANILLTLDGRTTGPDGPRDMSCIAPHGVTPQARDALAGMTTATTVLLGRSNYEGVAGFWPSVVNSPDADMRDRAFAQWLGAVEKLVFSTTLRDLTWHNASLADASPAQLVRRLRGLEGGDIRVLSSQSIIRQLLADDEVDRLEVTLAPDIVGEGARLFDDSIRPSRWAPQGPQLTDSGAIRVTYDRLR